MEEANRRASEAAFRANNQPGAEVDTLDLHGLYVKEAEKVWHMPSCTTPKSASTSSHTCSVTNCTKVCNQGAHTAHVLQVTSQRIDKAIADRRAHLVVIVGQGRAQLCMAPQT